MYCTLHFLWERDFSPWFLLTSSLGCTWGICRKSSFVITICYIDPFPLIFLLISWHMYSVFLFLQQKLAAPPIPETGKLRHRIGNWPGVCQQNLMTSPAVALCHLLACYWFWQTLKQCPWLSHLQLLAAFQLLASRLGPQQSCWWHSMVLPFCVFQVIFAH